MEIDRRMVLGGLAAGAIATQVNAAGPTSTSDRMRTFMMMRGSLDEKLVSSWMSASYFGVIDDRMEPLFDVAAAVFARYRRLPDGSYEAVSGELAWFLDKDTGKALDKFRNPYTGETVDVPLGGLSPSKITFGPDLSMRLARSVPGMEFAHEVLGPVVRGNDVWMTERSRSSFTLPGQAKPMRYSESNVFHAKRSALEAKGAKSVLSDVSFTNVVSWRPWLKMGDRPGHLTASGAGQHNSSLDMFPPAWIEATRARRPEVLKDPAAMLGPLWDAR